MKRPFHQRVGVTEYWIVDLDARLVERWRPSDDRPEIIVGQLDWRPDGASAELLLALDDLWEALPAELR